MSQQQNEQYMWISRFLTSSIGRKLLMSLTGLFLISFLLVHLVGNLQLLVNDNGDMFNLYAKFMTTNPVIKTVSYGLYAFIIIHAIQGILIWSKNSAARGTRYAVKNRVSSSYASRNMGWLGVIILVFIILHMWQFWFRMKMGTLDPVTIDGESVNNLYAPVALAFSQWWYVAIYVASMFVIALHLWHGFQSAFQTLGLNHKKYTPLIKTVGGIYSIIVPLGFAIIPLYFFFVLKG